jgi:hypothetical protein
MFEFLYNLAQVSYRGMNFRQAALKAIIKNYPDRPEVLDLLLDRSKNDPNEQVRKFAEEQLVIWRARARTSGSSLLSMLIYAQIDS